MYDVTLIIRAAGMYLNLPQIRRSNKRKCSDRACARVGFDRARKLFELSVRGTALAIRSGVIFQQCNLMLTFLILLCALSAIYVH